MTLLAPLGLFGSASPAAAVALVAGLILTTATIIGLLWKVIVRPLRTVSRRIQDFLDDWFGEEPRPGQPERPGAMARLAQLENNGGGSMRDTVDKIDATLAGVAVKAGEAVVAAKLAVNEAKVSRAAMTDAQAQNTRDLTDLSVRQQEQSQLSALQYGVLDQNITQLRADLSAHIEPTSILPHTHEVSEPVPVEETSS